VKPRHSQFASRWVVVGCSSNDGTAHASPGGDLRCPAKRLVVPTLNMGVAIATAQMYTVTHSDISSHAPLSRAAFGCRSTDPVTCADSYLSTRLSLCRFLAHRYRLGSGKYLRRSLSRHFWATGMSGHFTIMLTLLRSTSQKQ